MTTRAPRLRHAAIALAAAFPAIAAACHSTVVTGSFSSVPVNVVPLTGANLSGTVGQPLAQPVTVEVLDQYGMGVAHVAVLWLTGFRSGSVDSAMTVSDASGVAATRWTLGSVAQVDTLTATIPDGTSTTITAIANTGSVAGLRMAGAGAGAMRAPR